MSENILTIKRPVRRRLRKVVQRASDQAHGRRAHAILLLWKSGGRVSWVAECLCAARSSIDRWRTLFEDYGEEGLRPLPRGRTDYKATTAVMAQLAELVDGTPQDYGYLRSRWSSELLARELRRQRKVEVHATTVRRWLSRLRYGWLRARPTLICATREKPSGCVPSHRYWLLPRHGPRCSTLTKSISI